jgi:hypothetical protein
MMLRKGDAASNTLEAPGAHFHTTIRGIERGVIFRDDDDTELQRVIGFARAKGIKLVFVDPQFSVRSARTIAQSIGGRTVVADPLAADRAKNLLVVAREMAGATQ